METLYNKGEVSAVDPRIVAFIRRHHVMTVATVSGEGPYCANLFYAWMSGEGRFVVTSDAATRHGAEALADGRVAGSVVLETRVVGRVQGLQFRGRMERVEGEPARAARNAYLKRFPYAAAADLELWTIEPTLLKYTDNTLGFGKKLIWHK